MRVTVTWDAISRRTPEKEGERKAASWDVVFIPILYRDRNWKINSLTSEVSTSNARQPVLRLHPYFYSITASTSHLLHLMRNREAPTITPLFVTAQSAIECNWIVNLSRWCQVVRVVHTFRSSPSIHVWALKRCRQFCNIRDSVQNNAWQLLCYSESKSDIRSIWSESHYRKLNDTSQWLLDGNNTVGYSCELWWWWWWWHVGINDTL